MSAAPLRRASCVVGTTLAALGLLMIGGCLAPAASPVPAPQPTREGLSEADPTRPVLWTFRNEYRDLKNGDWADVLLLRHDRFFFRNLKIKGGGKGFVTRFDVPISIVNRGTTTKAGLGDIYTQALFIPRISRKFVFSVGSGLTLPTATDDLLGQGKVIIAPVVAPLWYMAKRRRLFTLRVQQFVSVAGRSSRPDVNYTIVDPFVGWSLGRRSWVFANTELKWDWRSKRGSGITGVQVGKMISEHYGISFKPEIPWGPGRLGGFNIKVVVLRFR